MGTLASDSTQKRPGPGVSFLDLRLDPPLSTSIIEDPAASPIHDAVFAIGEARSQLIEERRPDGSFDGVAQPDAARSQHHADEDDITRRIPCGDVQDMQESLLPARLPRQLYAVPQGSKVEMKLPAAPPPPTPPLKTLNGFTSRHSNMMQVPNFSHLAISYPAKSPTSPRWQSNLPSQEQPAGGEGESLWSSATQVPARSDSLQLRSRTLSTYGLPFRNSSKANEPSLDASAGIGEIPTSTSRRKSVLQPSLEERKMRTKSAFWNRKGVQLKSSIGSLRPNAATMKRTEDWQKPRDQKDTTLTKAKTMVNGVKNLGAAKSKRASEVTLPGFGDISTSVYRLDATQEECTRKESLTESERLDETGGQHESKKSKASSPESAYESSWDHLSMEPPSSQSQTQRDLHFPVAAEPSARRSAEPGRQLPKKALQTRENSQIPIDESVPNRTLNSPISNRIVRKPVHAAIKNFSVPAAAQDPSTSSSASTSPSNSHSTKSSFSFSRYTDDYDVDESDETMTTPRFFDDKHHTPEGQVQKSELKSHNWAHEQLLAAVGQADLPLTSPPPRNKSPETTTPNPAGRTRIVQSSISPQISPSGTSETSREKNLRDPILEINKSSPTNDILHKARSQSLSSTSTCSSCSCSSNSIASDSDNPYTHSQITHIQPQNSLIISLTSELKLAIAQELIFRRPVVIENCRGPKIGLGKMLADGPEPIITTSTRGHSDPPRPDLIPVNGVSVSSTAGPGVTKVANTPDLDLAARVGAKRQRGGSEVLDVRDALAEGPGARSEPGEGLKEVEVDGESTCATSNGSFTDASSTILCEG